MKAYLAGPYCRGATDGSIHCPYVAARARTKIYLFRLFLGPPKSLASSSSGGWSDSTFLEKMALRTGLVRRIEGVLFAVGLRGRGIVMGLVVGARHSRNV